MPARRARPRAAGFDQQPFHVQLSKQLYYAGSSLMWLDDERALKRAAHDSEEAISLWEHEGEQFRSLDDEALAHVYMATARLKLGEIDARWTQYGQSSHYHLSGKSPGFGDEYQNSPSTSTTTGSQTRGPQTAHGTSCAPPRSRGAQLPSYSDQGHRVRAPSRTVLEDESVPPARSRRGPPCRPRLLRASGWSPCHVTDAQGWLARPG
jgi:hypothetical protein